jgi:methionyl aminopeptidase
MQWPQRSVLVLRRQNSTASAPLPCRNMVQKPLRPGFMAFRGPCASASMMKRWIPGGRALRNGDLVKLDLVAEKDGLFADAAVTVRVGNVSATADALVRCAETAFWKAMAVARIGFRTCHIGREVERETRSNGFRVMPGFGGHGVGRNIHEAPSVPNYYDRACRAKLFDGLVIAVEPIITTGNGQGVLLSDRWTVRTADRSLSAHYEHTIVITKGAPLLLTA